ncbi:aminodeoxychorismate lyase [Rarobacter faecitabidus]|uniref:Branched-chain amino acid aminotransferase n=1 Tax=Rarobacter faecitabidus TaxID=13243 RepID=A0A542ZVH6_RARFA|nr:aminotransferase class IV [Rarobacter faecitabidus]TQL64321.1 branched-chain amino acid aminotransferase [Rarobacter faecitabidus]
MVDRVMYATWIDGVVQMGPASVSTADHAFLLGDGVFETFLWRGGRVVGFDDHLERLMESLERLGILVPPNGELERSVAEVAIYLADRLDPSHPLRVRITVSSGDGPSGLARGGRPVLCVSAMPLPRGSGDPVRASIAPWPRNEWGALAGIKSVSKGEDIIAAREVRGSGANEAIWLNTRGDLCETATANVYVVQADRIVTPNLASGCLPGIARKLLLQHAPASKIPLVEERVPGDILDRVRSGTAGLLLSSAVRGVVQVDELDGVVLSRLPLGKRLQELWQQIVGDHSRVVALRARD